MSSGVMAKSSVVMPQLPLVPIQPLQLTACSAASVLPGSPPSHRNSSPALINMDDDVSGSSNFGAENDSHNGQQPQQSFCLKWNNYQSNVTTTFKELLAEEDFVDITLTADGGALKAHKVRTSFLFVVYNLLVAKTSTKGIVLKYSQINFRLYFLLVLHTFVTSYVEFRHGSIL